ncbi:MAG: hypothetical protein LBR34_04425 [Prevotella sp.]|jgi:hypothetical protein|nr:hypothetical protein [Prevotella sp.]
MGYYLKDNVAEVIVPPKVTLAGNPAFVEFRSLTEATETPDFYTLTVHGYNEGNEMPLFRINELKSKQSYCISGTTERGEAGDSLFYIDPLHPDPAAVAENIRNCLMKRPFFRNNFELVIPFTHAEENESCIEIRPKGKGINFAFEFELQTDSPLVAFEGEPADTETSDSIAGNAENCTLVLDIYSNTGVFPGENDAPSDTQRGKFLASLSKNYYEKHLWFDVNMLLRRKVAYSSAFLDSALWCDAGTVCDYRFTAKRNADANSERFYCSGVMYVLNGCDKYLASGNMDDYTFDVMSPFTVRPLTNRSVVSHTKGQKQYFNFILKDALHSPDIPMTESLIGLSYRFYTRSGEYTGDNIAHEQNQRSFHIVNTIEIGLDRQIEIHENITGTKVGKVDVSLCCDEIEASEAITFKIEPEYMQGLNDFAFLNRLGGWESFNFGGTSAVELKPKRETAYATLVPDFGVSSHLESAAQCSVEESLCVKTLPLNRSEMAWLRELSSAAAVYELRTKRAVIIDDLTLKYNSKDELFQAEMKYHYSAVIQ